MILNIVSNQISDTKAKVLNAYSNNTPITNVDIDVLPIPENRLGKIAELYINPTTGELWYEYIDAPMTETEQILFDKLAEMQAAMDELILGGV